MKRWLMILCVVMFFCGGCSTSSTENQQQQTIRLISDLPKESAGYRQLERFEKEVEIASDGAIQVCLYAQNQWDSDTTLNEYVQADMVEMACVSTTVLSETIPEYRLFDLPCLFSQSTDVAQYQQQYGQQMLAYAQKDNQMGFGLVANGYYYLQQNVRPITTEADFSGLILNGRYNEKHRDGYALLGVQLKDGFDKALTGNRSMTEGDLAQLIQVNAVNEGSYLSDPQLFYALEVCLVWKTWWNGLNVETQQLLRKAFDKSLEKESDYQNQQGVEWLAPLGGISYNPLSNEVKERLYLQLLPMMQAEIAASQNPLGSGFYTPPIAEDLTSKQ